MGLNDKKPLHIKGRPMRYLFYTIYVGKNYWTRYFNLDEIIPLAYYINSAKARSFNNMPSETGRSLKKYKFHNK
jgi:hypothetical protein